MNLLDIYSDRVRLMITDPINYWWITNDLVRERRVLDKELSNVSLDNEAFKAFRQEHPSANVDGYSWSESPKQYKRFFIENSFDNILIVNDSSPMLLTRKFIILINGRSYCIIRQSLVSSQSVPKWGAHGGLLLGDENKIDLWFPDTPEDRTNLLLLKLSV